MSVRLRAEEALREHQDRIGVLRGGANLYPGTAAKIVSDEWEPEYEKMRSALKRINAIKTDVPRMGFQEYYDAVTDIAREALS